MRKWIGAAVFAATIAVPGMAMAASAIATANVNLRAGPSTAYPVVNVIGSGDNVTVLGCLSNRSWCDVSYAGQRGWMSSSYLAFLENGRRYTGPGAVTALRAPAITFSFGSYWDNHYRGRSFYRDRARWEHRHHDRRHWDRDRDRRGHWERDRDRDRWERDRRDRRDARRNPRDERRDFRDERRAPNDIRRWLRPAPLYE